MPQNVAGKAFFSGVQQERIIPNVSGIAFHLSLLPQNPVDSCTSCGLQIREPDRHNTPRAVASVREAKCRVVQSVCKVLTIKINVLIGCIAVQNTKKQQCIH